MAVEVFVPKMSDHMEYGEIVAWAVVEGDRVEAGQPLLELQTDKVVADLEAPASGVLRGVRPGAVPGAQVPVGETIAYIADEGEAVPALPPLRAQTPSPSRPTLEPAGPEPSPEKVRAAPAARRLARELGIDLAEVAGSGPQGQIRADDVREHARRLETPELGPESYRADADEGMAPETATEAATIVAHFVSVYVEVDMTVAYDVLGASGEPVDGSRLTTLVSRAANKALAEMRLSPQGAGVPLVLTDLGSLGIDGSCAAPRLDGGIGLDLGRIAKRPVGLPDDSIALRPIMRLTLSLDERSLGRMQGAKLLGRIARLVEEPVLLL